MLKAEYLHYQVRGDAYATTIPLLHCLAARVLITVILRLLLSVMCQDVRYCLLKSLKALAEKHKGGEANGGSSR